MGARCGRAQEFRNRTETTRSAGVVVTRSAIGRSMSRFASATFLVALLALAAAPAWALTARPVQPARTASPSGQIAYDPNGEAIATGAPRRLSPLAGRDSAAWAPAGKHGSRSHGHIKVAAKPLKTVR